MSSLPKTVRVLEQISEQSGRLVSWLVLLLILLTLFVAVPRYLLSNEWFLGLQLFGLDWDAIRGHYSRNVNAFNDGIVYLHATIFMVGVAYALKHGDHVRIDILYRNFTPRTRARVDVLGVLLFFFPTFIVILYMSWDYVVSSWQIREGSASPGGLPFVYAFKTLLPTMCLLMLIQGTALLLRRVLVLRNQSMPDEETDGEML